MTNDHFGASTLAGAVLAVALSFALLLVPACGDEDDPASDTGAGSDATDSGGDADATEEVGVDTAPDAPEDADPDLVEDTLPEVAEDVDLADDPDAHGDADTIGDPDGDASADLPDDAGAPDADAVDEPDAEADPVELAPFASNPIFLTANATIASGEVVLPAASGGSPPYRYTAGPLPTGVLFSETQRALRGTPTVGGATSLVYRATDSRGAFDEATVEVVVGADVFPPNPPTGLTFVDAERGATALRPADFGFSWTQSTSADVDRQLIYLYPAGGVDEGGEPIAELPASASSFTLTELLDSHGDCLDLSSDYVADWVLFDRVGNRAPAEDAGVEARAPFRLAFTSRGPDFTSRLTNSTFDSGISGWSPRAESDGGTPSAAVSWDAAYDAGNCGTSGAIRVQNDAISGEDVRGAVNAIAYECVAITGTRTYGISVDIFIPPGQERDGIAFASATWFPEDGCTGIPQGNIATPTFGHTDGWELAYFDGSAAPRTAVSAEVRLYVTKTIPGEGQPDDGVFEAYFDNAVFGRNE